MLEELKKTANGIALLKDWVGSGLEPVDMALADSRAHACCRGKDGKKCPKNVQGKWWNTATGMVADAIRTQLNFKDGAKLHTALEDELGTCDICLCNLPLKVWCPAEHIRNHITEEKLEKFPDWCWIKKELSK